MSGPTLMGSCLRKVCYLTKRAARDAAQRVFKIHGLRVRPYCCEHCRGFHLTKEGA